MSVMKQGLLTLAQEINLACAKLNTGLAAVAVVVAIVTLSVAVMRLPEFYPLSPGLGTDSPPILDESMP